MSYDTRIDEWLTRIEGLDSAACAAKILELIDGPDGPDRVVAEFLHGIPRDLGLLAAVRAGLLERLDRARGKGARQLRFVVAIQALYGLDMWGNKCERASNPLWSEDPDESASAIKALGKALEGAADEVVAGDIVQLLRETAHPEAVHVMFEALCRSDCGRSTGPVRDAMVALFGQYPHHRISFEIDIDTDHPNVAQALYALCVLYPFHGHGLEAELTHPDVDD